MQAINHTLAAGVIAVTIKQPALIAPLALASHFVLDVIPHYGNHPRHKRGTRVYYKIIVIDGILSILTYLIMLSAWPQLRLAITIAVFFALLPDLLWPLALVIKQKGPLWAFFRFHKNIQHESPRGAIIEMAAFGTLDVILAVLH